MFEIIIISLLIALVIVQAFPIYLHYRDHGKLNDIMLSPEDMKNLLIEAMEHHRAYSQAPYMYFPHSLRFNGSKWQVFFPDDERLTGEGDTVVDAINDYNRKFFTPESKPVSLEEPCGP